MSTASAVTFAKSTDDIGESQPAELSDEALMAQVAQTNPSAFARLFERYRDQIFSYLARLAGRALAEDLTQTTFLSVLANSRRFASQHRFKPWLYAIATNAFRDHARRARWERPIERPGGNAPEVVPPVYHDSGLKSAVWSALQQLPERQRLPVVMHRFQDMSFVEIGEALQSDEHVVRARAHRGYRRLRELLRSVWEEP
jgi:RNA polymerase sigma-70 factor (ECF subfamily)